LIVTRADQILPFLASAVLYLVLAICVALPYKVQHWTSIYQAPPNSMLTTLDSSRLHRFRY